MLRESDNLILEMSIFQKYYIFRHSKLEIALAIPASNEWKIEANNSTAQVLRYIIGVVFMVKYFNQNVTIFFTMKFKYF